MTIAMNNSLQSTFIEIILHEKEIFFEKACETFLSFLLEEISKEINFIFYGAIPALVYKKHVPTFQSYNNDKGTRTAPVAINIFHTSF